MKNKLRKLSITLITSAALSAVFACGTVFASDMQLTDEESALEPEIYENSESTDGTNMQAPFIFSEISVEADGYLIKISGNLPRNATLTAEHVIDTDEIEEQINGSIPGNAGANVHFAVQEVFNIDIYDEYGSKWQPCDYDETVNVYITGVEIKNGIKEISEDYGINEEVTTEVYRIEGNTVDLMTAKTDPDHDAIEFDTDHFTKYVIGSKSVTGAIATFNCGYSGGSPTSSVKLYVIQNDTDSSKYDIVVIGTGRMSEYIRYGGIDDGGWFTDPAWASYLPYTENIIIESGVTKVGNYAFSCSSISSLTVAAGIEELGNGCFYGCSSLANVSLPTSLTKIDEKAFNFCTSLTSLSIPANVTDIGKFAFDRCGFEYLTLPDGLLTLGEYAFQGVPLKEIDIPAGLTLLDMGAFSSCRSLERVGLPEGLEEISSSAFYGCSSLKSIKIPDSVTAINGLAFGYCDSMTVIEGGAGITTLGSMVFYAGSTVETRVITENDLLRTYDYSASRRNAIISLGSWPMGNSSGEHETLIWSNATGDDNIIATVFQNPDRATYTLEFTGSGQMAGVWSYYNLPWYTYISNIKKVTFEDGIENIGQSMIEEYPITEISFPDSVTKIGERAFYWCNKLTSIEFGSGITSIGDRAFWVSNSIFVYTEITGNTDAEAVLSYAWVDSYRAKLPKYKVINAENNEIIIEENFSDNLKISSINLSGYTGTLYLDSGCTEELTLPYYSFSDSVFYLDIEAGSIFTSAAVVRNPVNPTEMYAYSAEWFSSITKHRDGTDVEVEWFNDMYSPFSVDFTGLSIEFKTADMVKETLVYTENEYISDNAEEVNGFKVTPLRLYNSDFEFDKNILNGGDVISFKCHDEGPDLEKEKILLIPGHTVSMNCDIRISKNGLQKTVTVPVTVKVVSHDLEMPSDARLDLFGKVDYSNAPNVKVSDTCMEIRMYEYSPYKTTVIGVLKSDYYDLYKYDESNRTYILLGKDDLLENNTRYNLTPNQGSNPKDIIFDGSFTYHDTILNFYYNGGSSYYFDYSLDVYYDLREIGLGFKCTHPIVEAPEGTFYYDSIDTLGIDLRKYGSVRYDVYGIKIDESEYSMDENFDFEDVAIKGGFYHYGVRSPGEKQIRAYHLFNSAQCYKDGNYYVFYIVPVFGATLESSYTVKLPASVELTKGDTGAGGKFNLFAKGRIAALNTLHVFLNNPAVNKLTGQNTSTQIPFSVSRTKGSDYFYCDSIEEDYTENGNEYSVSISEDDIENAPVDTYTGSITVEYRIEPRF